MKRQPFTKKTGPHVYMLPALLVFAVSLFYLFFKTIHPNLYKTNRIGQAKLFVGLGNYVELFTSKSFSNSLTVTSAFMVVVVADNMILGLLSVMLYNRSFPGIRVFSAIYAPPMAIASSSAAMIFRIMLHPSIGIVNKLLGLDINWANGPKYALVCVASLTAWLNGEVNFLYFSANLSNIGGSICGRASVDGAGEVQKFSRLILPGLSPIMFHTLVMNIVQAFQVLGQMKVLIKGGPRESVDLIAYPIYRGAFFNYKSGSTVTQSVTLFAIIMTLMPVMLKVEKRGASY